MKLSNQAETFFDSEYLVSDQLNKFFNLSGNLLCIAGFDGYFKKINPAFSDILGYTETELLARPINDFVYIDDQDSTINARKNTHSGTLLLHFENRYLTKDGKIVWLYWTSIPDVDQQLVFSMAKDITAKKKLQEEKNHFIENLAKTNLDLKNFTQLTSHDMRSPIKNLMAIFGMLDLSKIQDQETLELVKLLKATTENLNETVNNYVDILMENDKLTIRKEKLNLNSTLQTIVKSIGTLVKQSGTQIKTDFFAFDEIIFNKLYLESIFLNLITNAIKYAAPDRSPLITIKTQVTDDVPQLVFSDNGSGMDLDKVKNKIFRLYQVFHNHPESKGIGLHLVHNHITAMGGKIEVASEVGKGTTFTISLKV